jgi:para-aminobenzoate synthetase component II
MNVCVLILDNYDSFVFNLAQGFGAHGATVRVVRSDAVTTDALACEPPDLLVISPGPGVPERAGIAVAAVRALSGRVPILGVCLGHQAIAAAFGGKVVRAQRVVHGKATAIAHDGEGLFAGIPSPLRAGRYHSLIVEEASLPDALAVTARSDDGLLMALRHRTHPTFGVQFHPESILTKQGPAMLENALRIAVAFAPAPVAGGGS